MHTKSLLRQAIRYATAAGAATWLVACASLPEEDQVSPLEQQRSVSTLAELESIDIDVAPAQIEDVSPESALESYRQAVNLFTNPEQKAASLRRMADLAMESAEKGDGNTLTEAPGVETQIDDAAAVDVEIDKMLFKSFMESAEASGSREEMIANLDLAASLVSGLAGEELSSSYATATKLYEQLLATTDDPAQRAEAYYLLAKAYDLNAELEKSI